MSRVDIKAILADPVLRQDLLDSMSDIGPDGTHIPYPLYSRQYPRGEGHPQCLNPQCSSEFCIAIRAAKREQSR